jgi:outer membrane protein insertion porin family
VHGHRDMRLRLTLCACAALLSLAPGPGRAADGPPGPAAETGAGGESPPAGAMVAEAEVVGHESLREREVLNALSLREGAAFDEESLARGVDSLLRQLREFGRPFARVTVQWDAASGNDATAEGAVPVDVTVLIDEGPRIEVGDLEFIGAEGPVPREAFRVRRTRAGSVPGGGALAEDIGALLDHYANDGRPFAEVTLPSFATLEDGRLDATVSVDEGPETWFGDVIIAGNRITRNHVIARETGIVRGDLYSGKRLAAVRSRLEKLPYIAAVDDPVVAVDPSTGEATVGVRVEEGTANRITGVLGFSGGPGGAEDEIAGRVDIELENIAGTGRSASASWEQLRSRHTEIAFAYNEPWLLGSPVDIGVQGAQSIRDTLYTTTEADLLVTARMGDRTRLTWSLGGQRYVPGSLAESTTTTVRTAFSTTYDGSDAFWNPTRGIRLSAGVEYSAKRVRDDGRSERAGTFTGEAYQFVPLAPRQVLALRMRGQLLESTEEDVPFHELLVLGGARSLRGYREEQFHGTRTALGSIEYRLLLGRRARVIAFVDAGHWYLGGANSARGTELGYGIGLRGDTRLGTISLDYGLGEGDGLLDGKLHAGLIREF